MANIRYLQLVLHEANQLSCFSLEAVLTTEEDQLNHISINNHTG
jgi:hypothetical protein